MSDQPPVVDVAAVREQLLTHTHWTPDDTPCQCEDCRDYSQAVAALDQLQREIARLTQDVGAAYLQGIKQGHVEREADLAAAKAASVTERKLTNDYIRQLHAMQAERDAAKAALAQAEQERDRLRADADAQRQDAITTAIEHGWSES